MRGWMLWVGLFASCVAGEADPTIADGTVPHIVIAPRSSPFATALGTINSTTAGGLVTNESGTTTAFFIALASQPSATVTVTPQSSDTTEGTVSGALTFTTANWATPQTVTVTGVDDVLADGDVFYTISATTTSGDTNYNSLSQTLVLVTNLDDEGKPQVRIVSQSLTTDKTGATATFSVALTTQPTATVTVTLTSSDPNEGVISPASLTFTTTTWAMPQPVTLTGQPNVISSPARGATAYFANIGPLSSADGQYAALPTQSLFVSNVEPVQNQLRVIAGAVGSTGSGDGTGTAARFFTTGAPGGIARDAAGNLYVSDIVNQTIRKITTRGVVSTVAGQVGVANYGATTINGTGTGATFAWPGPMVFDSAGNLFILDWSGWRLRKMTPAGVVTHLNGGSPYYPNGMTIDGSDNLYITQTSICRILKVTAGGAFSNFIGTGAVGSADGTGTAASVDSPSGIVYNPVTSLLYFADFGKHTIRASTLGGVVTTFAGAAGATGTLDATGTAARFNAPGAMSVDANGNLYVVDNVSTIRKITTGGVVTTILGAPGVSSVVTGPLDSARVKAPTALTIVGGALFMLSDDALLRAY